MHKAGYLGSNPGPGTNFSLNVLTDDSDFEEADNDQQAQKL